ncbi:MAG: KUP/HAK/KT family potassium transporter [Saprospiraceae bacterium]|nr:KUP/HAK/KT family potassium transporter [Saprospiraceae bacterium]
MSQHHNHTQRLTRAGVLITLGIIFGDIGTSPLYVMKAIVGSAPISSELILGAVSLVFWTLTIQTTLKYVVLTLRADNKGEGGIFSLYTLVRRRRKWLLFPAILGGAAMLADGMITPPISVSSAIEGLEPLLHLAPDQYAERSKDSIVISEVVTLLGAPDSGAVSATHSMATQKMLNIMHPIEHDSHGGGKPNWLIMGIVMAIISALFFSQRFGTAAVGKGFGPIMLIWFSMLGLLGISQIIHEPGVFMALSPVYAVKTLLHSPSALLILSGVFLCTTGAEALYADLGHCGRKNIEVAWIFVKTTLVLNYLGQAAWLLQFEGQTLPENPFYGVMPDWFRWPGLIIATLATIVASQALISGAFTLASEAIRLGLLPKLTVKFPTDAKGQIYVPSVNTFLWAGCVGVVLFFKKSSAMEHAYGLAIILAMLSTTILLANWLVTRRVNPALVWLFLIAYLIIEGGFLFANALKFMEGGYVTLIMASLLFGFMLLWVMAKKIRQRYEDKVRINDYLDQLIMLSNDTRVAKYATNLVFLSDVASPKKAEAKVMYSILQTQPKRADIYWFVHIETTDEPHTQEYEVSRISDNDVYKVNFRLGFRVQQRMNVFMKKVIEEMVEAGEIDMNNRYHSFSTQYPTGDMKFVIIQEFLSHDNELPWTEQLILEIYLAAKSWVSSPKNWFGLDSDSVEMEEAPLILQPIKEVKLTKTNRRKG